MINCSSCLLVGKPYFLPVRFPCLALLFLEPNTPRNAAGDLDLIYYDFINIIPSGMCILNKSREICVIKMNTVRKQHTIMQ